jgi:hypothetical protein
MEVVSNTKACHDTRLINVQNKLRADPVIVLLQYVEILADRLRREAIKPSSLLASPNLGADLGISSPEAYNPVLSDRLKITSLTGDTFSRHTDLRMGRSVSETLLTKDVGNKALFLYLRKPLITLENILTRTMAIYAISERLDGYTMLQGGVSNRRTIFVYRVDSFKYCILCVSLWRHGGGAIDGESW